MPTREELHARALDRLVEGDLAGGIVELEACVAAAPGDAEAWLYLGQAREAAGEGDAEGAFARAVALGVGRVEAALGLARARAARGDADAALQALDEAARAWPGEPRVDLERGLALVTGRAHGAAIEPLERAAAGLGDDARPSYALGIAREGAGDVGGAIAAWREALRRDPGFVDARRTLADALAGLGEHAAAIVEVEAVLAARPWDEAVARNLEALRAALAELEVRRLLGKAPDAFAASALAREASLRPRRERGAPEAGPALRWGGPGGLEVWIALDAGGAAVEALTLVFADADRATRAEDDVFGVTVVGRDGRRERADFGTAASLTFLREAVGCPMTTAAALYARLCAGAAAAEWGGARVAFVEAARPGGDDRRPGLEARRRA